MPEIEGGGYPLDTPHIGPIFGRKGPGRGSLDMDGCGGDKFIAPDEKTSLFCFLTGPRKFKIPPGGSENPSARPAVGVGIGGLQLPLDSRGGVVPARRDEKLDEINFGKGVFWSISKDTKNGG